MALMVDISYISYTSLVVYLSTMDSITIRKGKIVLAEAVAWRCSVKKAFLKISQNSRETPVSEFLF